MKDVSMFHFLTLYKDKNYCKSNPYIYTKNKKLKYEVFSVYYCSSEKVNIYREFKDDLDQVNYLNDIKNMSLYNIKLKDESIDKILTLVTCEYSGEDNRMIIHAKLIKG